MEPDALEEEVLALLRRRAGPDLHAETDLVAETDLDSVDLLEVIADLEDRFGVHLDAESLQEVLTPRDLARVVHERGGRA